MFTPLAEVFVERMPLRQGDNILDIACGTGIVAPRVGPVGSITGVDLNAGMLDVARTAAQDTPTQLTWRQGDAEHLPFEDASFDVVLCQQGMQFFPNKLAAAREMHRVLKPDGRVGICVWRGIEYSPALSAVSIVLSRHLDTKTIASLRAPFSFGDDVQIRAILEGAGFSDARLETATLTRKMLPPDQSIPGLIASTPAASAFADLDETIRTTVVSKVAEALADYRTADGFSVPQETYIVQATRPA